MKIQASIIILSILIIFVLLYAFSGSCSMKCSESEKYRYGGGGYTNQCEFQPACLWDTARWVTLSNGQQGVCTLHGKACPAFSMDHSRNMWAGLSPTMADDIYSRELVLKGQERFQQNLDENYGFDEGTGSGETALEMLV